MDDLIKDIQQRTGLPADKVLEVVTMVTDYLRNALPEDLVQQVSSYLGMAAESAGGVAGGVAGSARDIATTSAATASGAISSATDAAQSAFTTARDAVQERITSSDD